jgi:hypothetical protein
MQGVRSCCTKIAEQFGRYWHIYIYIWEGFRISARLQPHWGNSPSDMLLVAAASFLAPSGALAAASLTGSRLKVDEGSDARSGSTVNLSKQRLDGLR